MRVTKRSTSRGGARGTKQATRAGATSVLAPAAVPDTVPDTTLAVGAHAVSADPQHHGNARRFAPGHAQGMRLFAGVPHELIEPLLADCAVHTVAVGGVLLRPGEPNDAIYVLLSGLLHIRLDATDTDGGIAIEPGGNIGELSIIDGKPVSAFVVAAQECSVMRIPAEVFWDHIIPLPGVARNLLQVLSGRMRQNNDLILKRLAEHLRLELLERELKTANGIQASMLPSRFPLFPERTDVDLHAMMIAAREVGGDFYDAFFISPRQLFVAVGDVSGKGVPAALFMARSMTLLRMEAARGLAPHEILTRVNEALCTGNEAGMFVTVFCAVLDTATGELAYSNGGHNAPLSNAGGAYAYIEPPRGLVLGMMEGTPFLPATLTLAPGESLLLYTDGVTEAADPANALYEDERLLACLRGVPARASAAQAVAAVHADVADFVDGAEASDDLTLLALTWHGAP